VNDIHVVDYRIIYNEFWKNFRVTKQNIAKSLRVDGHTASRRIDEALNGGCVLNPQIRKRSFKNFKKYIYVVRCKDPLHLFKELKEDNKNIIYHAVLSGLFNLLVISKKKLDIDGVILVGGRCSDYHLAYAPYQSFNETQNKMIYMVKKFDKSKYRPENIIKNHWGESLDWWDSDFELLFRLLKYNARKAYTPIMREHNVASEKITHFFNLLDTTCTICTRFFPKGIAAYDPCLFMIETEYEDFIINLFSQLPTSSFFFKAENKLFIYAHVEKTSVRESGLDVYDVSQIWIPCLLEKLKKESIISAAEDAIFKFHYSKPI
jgi:hypothetical protein